ncbi:MAG: c-type cytochrome [Planctomycetales bacterium]|nr:c-type cytochrome [Planctomycetales bacterium]
MSTNRTQILAPLYAIAALAWMLSAATVNFGNEPLAAGLMERATYRGPVDLILADDESWAVTLNELSDTLSLVDLAAQRIVAEVPCAGRPAACARLPGNELLVSCRNAGLLRRFRVEYHAGRPVDLQSVVDITTGYEPLGVSVAPRLKQQPDRAYVGLMASGEVAEIDLSDNRLLRRWSVGKWPRYLAVSPDGTKLAVGLSGESTLAVFDLPSGELAYDEPLSGSINMGHMRCSANGQYVYFPWMIYRSNPIDPGNIRRGWVLASRIARVRLDGPATREAISLDVPGMAVADPHGLAVTPDQSTMAVTSAGTHELLVYSIEQMPFVGTGGPGDLIDESLLRNRRAFTRIELGGRPLGIESARDNRTLWIVNHTLDALQRVDLESRRVTAVISLGRPSTDSSEHIVHLGMEIFHDATRSLDQWYSCRSCHLDGGSNAKAMDTWNDGSELTVKTVLPLTGVAETGPWTWHGWQQDLDESIQNSFVSTMQGSRASTEDVAAVRAYLASLRPTPNPFLQALNAFNDDGYAAPNDQISANRTSIAQLVAQGSELFHSDAVGCVNCHAGPLATDGQIHDVGLGAHSDKYEGYNTPSLVGVYQKARLLHDGRAKSLRDVLTKWHTPSEVGDGAELSESQLDQLIAYLKTL